MRKGQNELKTFVGITRFMAQRIMPLLLGVAFIGTQTSCITTDLKKSISSHREIKDETEILESIKERESINQNEYSIVLYGPILFPFSHYATPWYSNYRISFKANEARFEPDGSLRNVEEREGLLKLDFGFSGLPYFHSILLHQNRRKIFDGFRFAAEKEFLAGRLAGPIRISDELRERLRSLHKFSEFDLILLSQLFQSDQIEFMYNITIRNPDGSIDKESHNEYKLVNEMSGKDLDMKLIEFNGATVDQ